VNPTSVFDRLVIVGLMDQCGGDVLTVEQKREAILTSGIFVRNSYCCLQQLSDVFPLRYLGPQV